jgi:hypothetical protein
MILAKDYIQTGFSIEDADRLDSAIKKEIDSTEKIIIDFDGITFFTTLFFNNALTKYVLQLTPEKYNQKFEIINLSDVGEITYAHSYDNAVEYFNLPPEKRQIQEQITKNENE